MKPASVYTKWLEGLDTDEDHVPSAAELDQHLLSLVLAKLPGPKVREVAKELEAERSVCSNSAHPAHHFYPEKLARCERFARLRREVRPQPK